MPAVEYDGDAAAPNRRSTWIVVAALAAVAVLVLTRGVVTLLVLAWLAVTVGVLVGLAYAAARAFGGASRGA